MALRGRWLDAWGCLSFACSCSSRSGVWPFEVGFCCCCFCWRFVDLAVGESFPGRAGLLLLQRCCLFLLLSLCQTTEDPGFYPMSDFRGFSGLCCPGSGFALHGCMGSKELRYYPPSIHRFWPSCPDLNHIGCLGQYNHFFDIGECLLESSRCSGFDMGCVMR